MSRSRRHQSRHRRHRRQRGGAATFGYSSTGEFGKAAFENADTSKGYLIANKTAITGGRRRRHRHQRSATRRHRRH